MPEIASSARRAVASLAARGVAVEDYLAHLGVDRAEMRNRVPVRKSAPCATRNVEYQTGERGV